MITTDQVTALAPDAASFKAGRALATPRKWEALGATDLALWGLASGSGKKPYQTQVDCSDLATKCSCPSRKFPCKHALGLLFIAAGSPSDLTDTTIPDWVTEWLESRKERATKAAAKKETTSGKTATPKNAAAAQKTPRKTRRPHRPGRRAPRSIHHRPHPQRPRPRPRRRPHHLVRPRPAPHRRPGTRPRQRRPPSRHHPPLHRHMGDHPPPPPRLPPPPPPHLPQAGNSLP